MKTDARLSRYWLDNCIINILLAQCINTYVMLDYYLL